MKKLFFLIFIFSLSFAELPFTFFFKDKKEFYSLNTATLLIPSFTIGGAIAKTDTDQQILDYYQSHIRSESINQFLSFWKLMGQEQVILPYAFIGLYGGLKSETPSGAFAKELFSRCARAFIVGTAPLHITRALVGGSRPTRTSTSSKWSPFHRRHGVSGHTYTGAILFINLAQMTDNTFFKTLFYATSTLTGLSRVNDKDHYPSQAFLGWMMAYAACNSVTKGTSNFKFTAGPDRVSLSMAF